MAESKQERINRINKANVEGLRAMYGGKKSAPKKSTAKKTGKKK